MHQNSKFAQTPYHKATFISLKGALIQTPILHYPDPLKRFIVYTVATDEAHGAQLSQEHNEAFPLHTFMGTQYSIPNKKGMVSIKP